MPVPSDRKIGTMPNMTAHWWVYDFEVCTDVAALKKALAKINHYGFDVVSVTQDASGTYTVFFRRLAA